MLPWPVSARIVNFFARLMRRTFGLASGFFGAAAGAAPALAPLALAPPFFDAFDPKRNSNIRIPRTRVTRSEAIGSRPHAPSDTKHGSGRNHPRSYVAAIVL